MAKQSVKPIVNPEPEVVKIVVSEQESKMARVPKKTPNDLLKSGSNGWSLK